MKLFKRDSIAGWTWRLCILFVVGYLILILIRYVSMFGWSLPRRMPDSMWLISFGALLVAAPTFAFCFTGKNSAKNQLGTLHARIAELESTAGGQDAPGHFPYPRPHVRITVDSLLALGASMIRNSQWTG